MTAIYDKITDQALGRLDIPYWKRSAKPSLNGEVQSLTNGPLAKLRYSLVGLLTPAYDTVLNYVVTDDSERDGVFLGLALELYHRDHKKWPVSLAELSPQYLPRVPVDPITGKPLHYKVVNGQPLVYSVGVDGVDDGGRATENIGTGAQLDHIPPNYFERQHEAARLSGRTDDWVLWSTEKSN